MAARRRPLIGRKALHAALGLGLLALVWVIDGITPPDLSFVVFYLLPVLYLTWQAGPTLGGAAAALSSAAWFLEDVTAGRPFHHPAVPYWNVAEKLVFFLVVVAFATRLKEAMRREAAAERARIEREIELARVVQARLFPASLPAVGTVDLAAVCRPARVVSGDYYDFMDLGAGRLGLALGDVSGKGMAAALLMASAQALLRGSRERAGEIGRLLAEVNRVLCPWSGGRSFITLFYAIHDPARRTLAYGNAGHLAPVILRAGTDPLRPVPVRLPATGPVVGLLPAARWRAETVPFEPGDTLVLFTDGITEATAASDEEFGEERLVAAAARGLGRGARGVEAAVLGDLADFLDGEPAQDDVTLVVARAR